MFTAMVNIRKTIFPAILLIGLFLSSCGSRYSLKRELVTFEKETIVFPERMIRIENGAFEICTICEEGKTQVLFFAPGECTHCALSHLKLAESLFEISNQYPQYNIVILFEPVEGECEDLVNQILQMGFDFPVYVDHERQFLNNTIPQDRRFHSFLLDEECHPVVVGNPLVSGKIRELVLGQIR